MAVLDSYSADTEFKGYSYLPGDAQSYSAVSFTGNANSGMVFALYLPDGTPAEYTYVGLPKRPSGARWPGVYIYFECSGWSTSDGTYADATADAITPANGGHIWQVLARGLPVIRVQLPVPNATAAVPGKGMYHAPGGTERRWEDVRYWSPQKAAIQAYQYIMYSADFIHGKIAGRGTGLVGFERRAVAGGTSAGAHCAGMVGLRPDQALSVMTYGEGTYPTVPNAFVVLSTCVPVVYKYTTAATFFDNIPTSETSGQGATTLFSGNATITASTKKIALAAAWTTVPLAGSTAYITGLATNDDPEVIRITSVTDNNPTYELTYDSDHNTLVNEGPVAVVIKDATSETANTTLSTAVVRYQYEMSHWPHFGGRNGNFIPPTLYQSEASIQSLQGAGGLTRLGEPFLRDMVGAGGGATAGAHALDNGLLMKSAFPNQVKLYGPSTTVRDVVNLYWPGLWDGELADPNARGVAGYTDGTVVDFIFEHLTDEPWDRNPEGPIQRWGQVETTGRFILPPHPKRKEAVIRNVSASDTVGTAFAGTVLEYGRSPGSVWKRLADGSEQVIPGGNAIYCKGISAQGKYSITEYF